jgi:hypothetical protein
VPERGRAQYGSPAVPQAEEAPPSHLHGRLPEVFRIRPQRRRAALSLALARLRTPEGGSEA